MKSRDDLVKDAAELYRRADLERRIARGVLDGADESEVASMVGLPDRQVHGVLSKLAERAAAESVEISRIHAIRQTVLLTELYKSASEQWEKTSDPRYAEQMRGSLSDIRKIWGVEAAQRIQLGGTLNVRAGVLGGILGGMDDATLELLEKCFTECDGGRGSDGEGLPALEGPREVGGSVSLGGGSSH